ALAGADAEPSAAPGLVWRDGATIRRSPDTEPEPELDKLAWPTRRKPYDRYHGLAIVNMLGSRGCAYRCAFCSIAAWHKLCGGERYRQRSAAGLAAEMGCLWRDGVRLFNFHDDNFLGARRAENLVRVEALRTALGAQGVGQLAFAIKARPDAVDEEVFARLREMGLFRVFLGIEAGTEESLRQLGRGQKLADNERALDILNGLDVHTAFNLLLLNPESTLDDVAGNVAFLRRHLDNPLNFCRTEIYAGTPLERKLRAEGRLRGDYFGLDYAIRNPEPEQAFELMRAAFYDRNFGPHPLHYLSGQVDYEHQVRMDFFGTTPAVRAAAKGYVRRVNDNTVSYLEEIVAAVRAGRATVALAADLAARVERDDRRLHAEGDEVLARIRDIPERTRPARGSGRTRAALAASVALTLAGCRQPDTQHMEMAPPPQPPPTGAPPLPTGDGSVLVPVKEDAGAPASPPDAGSPFATPPDAGPITPPTYTQPMEAAPRWPPPPPPTYTQPMEAAPNWPPPPPPPPDTHMREAAPPWGPDDPRNR
ncbi:MAG: radical SAM protein, partial [Myxococcales bacterium]|nr:radical SAM protein [Myxococcales bacterium]